MRFLSVDLNAVLPRIRLPDKPAWRPVCVLPSLKVSLVYWLEAALLKNVLWCWLFSTGDGIPTVFVAVAGRSNGLGPVMSGNSTYPVINCPPLTPDWGAQDVWSSLRMPSGELISKRTQSQTRWGEQPLIWSSGLSPGRSRMLHHPFSWSCCSVRSTDLWPDQSSGLVQSSGLHAQHLGVSQAGRPEITGLQPLIG